MKKRAWRAGRKILHIDMDAFYAAIEQRDRPELRGKPVIVGGNPESRGVVSTASYEARKFGIHSAMPSATAKRLCPQGIFLFPDFEKYERTSRIIQGILRKYTRLVEPISLDEAYLDVTQNTLKLEDPVDVASLIKQNIRAATKLTASAGVAPNKFLAKIASDFKKPDGLFVVYPEEAQAFLEPLSVRKIPGVGPVSEKKLVSWGVSTCLQLREKSETALRARFGKFGRDLYEMARGIDDSPVEEPLFPKQIGSEETFDRDMTNLSPMREKLRELAQSAWKRLEQEGLKGRTVTLKVKYADFTVITRSRTLPHFLKPEDLFEETVRLLEEKTQAARKPVRLLGVSVSHFEWEENASQLELFPETR